MLPMSGTWRASSYLELPKEAWDMPGLLSDCPQCGRPLKFNPFLVDASQGHAPR